MCRPGSTIRTAMLARMSPRDLLKAENPLVHEAAMAQTTGTGFGGTEL